MSVVRAKQVLNTATNDLQVKSTGKLSIDSTDSLELNSSGGVIKIGHDKVPIDIEIGNSEAEKNIILGNVTGDSSVTINAGNSGTINIGKTKTKTINIGNGFSNITVNASTIKMNASTGGIDLSSQATPTLTFDTGDTLSYNKSTNVLTTSSGITFNVDGATTLDQVTIDTTDGTFSVSGTNGVTINPAGALTLNSSGSTIGLGNDAVAQNINIGTGAAARTIIMGNLDTTTNTTLRAGTGGLSLQTSEPSTGNSFVIVQRNLKIAEGTSTSDTVLGYKLNIAGTGHTDNISNDTTVSNIDAVFIQAGTIIRNPDGAGAGVYTNASTVRITGEPSIASGSTTITNSYGLNVDGKVNFSNGTASTSTTTGALIIAGGLGVGERINASGIVTASSFKLSGNGGYEFIEKKTVTSASTVEFTSVPSYRSYKLIVALKLPAGVSSDELNVQVGHGAGPTYLTASYEEVRHTNAAISTLSGLSAFLLFNRGNTDISSCTGELHIFGRSAGTSDRFNFSNNVWNYPGAVAYTTGMSGFVPTSVGITQVTAIKLMSTATGGGALIANLTGTVSLFGFDP